MSAKSQLLRMSSSVPGGAYSWYVEVHHRILAPEGIRCVCEFSVGYGRRNACLVESVYKFYSFLWWGLWIFTVEG